MSTTVATPQPQTGTPPSIRSAFKPATKASRSTDAHDQKQLKEKEATLAELKKLLEGESELFAGMGKASAGNVRSILAYCKHIEHAQDELKGNGIKALNCNPWADFIAKCKGGKSTVSKAISVAEHKGINNPKNLQYLPASLKTLYELAQGMDEDDFQKAPKSTTEKEGTINPWINYTEARALCGKNPHPIESRII